MPFFHSAPAPLAKASGSMPITTAIVVIRIGRNLVRPDSINASMVPLPRYSTCAGIPVTELLSKEQIDAIVKRTAGGGAEIVNLLKTGSAYYAPSAAAVEMTESILKDKKRILPCAAFLEGEYGIKGLYVGVPCKLGAKGLEQVIEITLTAEERIALQKSAAAVQELVDILGI